MPERYKERWSYYNKLLQAQAQCHEVISYNIWQKKIEAPLLRALPDLNDEQRDLFVHVDLDVPKPVSSDQWVVIVRPGSYLSSWALAAFAQQINRVSSVQSLLVLYGDEDQAVGISRHSPRFKPAWNLELFLSDPHYSSHWVVQGKFWNEMLEQAYLIQFPLKGWWALHYALLLEADRRHSHGQRSIQHLPIIGSCLDGDFGASEAQRQQMHHVGR